MLNCIIFQMQARVDMIGQCSYMYVRLVNQQDQPHVSFVMGKARVAPLKAITIPRLELTAAVVSTKVSQCLKQELDYQDVANCFGPIVKL